MAKNTISLIAGIFLLISQFTFVLHELEHVAADDGDEICEFCIAAHSLSSLLTGDFTAGIATVSPHDFPVIDNSQIWLKPRLTQFARAPPVTPA